MKFLVPVVIGLVLAALIAITEVNAENQTRDTIYLLTHEETLAGQKDMSRYSNITKPEPIHTMNESTARLYPNVTWCGRNGCIVNRPCSFPFTRCESPLTLMVMYNVNATNPYRPGPVIGYSLSGWPLQNPVTITGPGKPGVFRPFDNLAGWFA